jgi:antitoxin component of MazEF toxin-antitoxin module
MLKTRVRRVGRGLGITLPGAIIDNYHLHEGDELSLLETKEGIVLKPLDPKLSEWAKSFRKLNQRYRNTLTGLAR